MPKYYGYRSCYCKGGLVRADSLHVFPNDTRSRSTYKSHFLSLAHIHIHIHTHTPPKMADQSWQPIRQLLVERDPRVSSTRRKTQDARNVLLLSDSSKVGTLFTCIDVAFGFRALVWASRLPMLVDVLWLAHPESGCPLKRGYHHRGFSDFPTRSQAGGNHHRIIAEDL